VVRAGDFFGPKAGNSWFAQGLVKPGKPVRTVTQPGRVGVGHQWSYLPDVARTMVLLLQHEEKLQAFENVHMAGHWDADGSQMVESVRRVVSAAGGQTPTASRFPWWLLGLASPFVTVFREMKEMRYLWQQPVQMGNARLLALLGHEPHTPWDDAVRASLEGLGCLSVAGNGVARLQAR
jgi:nucleoside-diphosphate-sugar epimerase